MGPSLTCCSPFFLSLYSQNCSDRILSKWCQQCDEMFCSTCCDELHHHGKKVKHHRIPFDVCVECEYQTASRICKCVTVSCWTLPAMLRFCSPLIFFFSATVLSPPFLCRQRMFGYILRYVLLEMSQQRKFKTPYMETTVGFMHVLSRSRYKISSTSQRTRCTSISNTTVL